MRVGRPARQPASPPELATTTTSPGLPTVRFYAARCVLGARAVGAPWGLAAPSFRYTICVW